MSSYYRFLRVEYLLGPRGRLGRGTSDSRAASYFRIACLLTHLGPVSVTPMPGQASFISVVTFDVIRLAEEGQILFFSRWFMKQDGPEVGNIRNRPWAHFRNS